MTDLVDVYVVPGKVSGLVRVDLLAELPNEEGRVLPNNIADQTEILPIKPENFIVRNVISFGTS